MNYFIWNDGNEEGPLSESDFVDRVGRNAFPVGSYWRTEEQTEWSVLDPKLLGGLTKKYAPPTLPPPPPVSPLAPCPVCSHLVSRTAFTCPNCGHPLRVQVQGKSRGAYIILGLLFGTLGVHNFYAGRTTPGVIQMVATLSSIILIVPVFLVAIWAVAEVCTVKLDGDGVQMV